jgi:peptidoglycan/LPS O-acetylase OafA/YrhL
VTSAAVPARPVPVLDSFRALAALGILLYHCWLLSGPAGARRRLRDVLSSSFLAVTLFFVISGFVLFLPVARRGGSFGPVASYARAAPPASCRPTTSSSPPACSRTSC